VWYFNKGLFTALILAFVFATVAGTLSHECGHYLVAKSLGYKATIHYGYIRFGENQLGDSINAMRHRYSKEIMMNQGFPGKQNYDRLYHEYSKEWFWIILAGPLQTLLSRPLKSLFRV
jgi:hypothetical protein